MRLSRYSWLLLLTGCPSPTNLSKSLGLEQVEPAAITMFMVDSPTLPYPGGMVTFTWQTTNASVVLLDNGGGDVTELGNKALAVTETTTFQLAAANQAGSDVKTVTVTVAGGPPVIGAFTASQTALPYGGGSIVLSWSVSNAKAVTLSPEPGTVALAAQYSASIAATTTFVLIAENDTAQTSANVVVNVSASTTVSGKVITEVGSAAVTGATVAVLAGGSSTATTDASGGFSLPNVTPPYDVVVTAASGAFATIYRGLSRLNPTLMAMGTQPTLGYTAAVTGQVAGSTDNMLIEILIDNGYDGYAYCDGSGNYAIDDTGLSSEPNWFGQPYVTGQIFGIDVTDPMAPKFGIAPITLASNGDFGNVNFTASTVGVFAVSGLCVPPSSPTGYTVFQTELGVYGPVRFYVPVVGPTFLGEQPDVPVPGTLTYAACTANGSNGEWLTTRVGGLPTGPTFIYMAPPAAPLLQSPSSGATKVGYNTTFSWSGAPTGHVNWLHLTSAGAPGPVIDVFTESSSDTLPNLSTLAIGLPAATGYNWTVTSIGPTTVDGLLGPIFPVSFVLQELNSFNLLQSTTRGFTTP